MPDDPIQTAAEAFEATAIPREHSVHADGAGPDGVSLPPNARKARSPAEWAYQRLIVYIKKFEEGLDQDHEVAMGFVGSATGTMRIQGIGYFDPDLVTFHGSDPLGNRMQAIQHVSQLNVLLRALPKPDSKSAPRRIGFRLVADIEDDAENGETPGETA